MADKKTKLILVSQVFYPDETATASILTDIAVEIAGDSRIEVEVICAQPSYSTRQRQKREKSYKNISISYMRGTNFFKGNLMGRLLNYFTFSVSLFFTLMLAKDRTPIFTVTNPPFLGILIWLISRIKSRPYVYIVHDVQPDGLVRLGMLKEKGLPAKMWRTFNKGVLGNAGKILVLGRDMLDWVRHTEPSAMARTLYVPNCQNENLFYATDYPENAFVKKHNLFDRFVVQYSGNMGLWNDMKTLAQAAKMLENSGITFCFIGGGMRQQEMMDTWNNKVPSNTYLFPFQSRDQIGFSLTACHVALISLRKGLEGIAVPSKLYGILAAGKAIIAQVPQRSEIAQVVQEESCGMVVEPHDPDSLVAAIKYLKDNESRRIQMAHNARRAFEEKYTTKKTAQRYIEILKAV
jgi:glycosyltransferase involved in cell wall biosynthesis